MSSGASGANLSCFYLQEPASHRTSRNPRGTTTTPPCLFVTTKASSITATSHRCSPLGRANTVSRQGEDEGQPGGTRHQVVRGPVPLQLDLRILSSLLNSLHPDPLSSLLSRLTLSSPLLSCLSLTLSSPLYSWI
jgi:hypothetical protein